MDTFTLPSGVSYLDGTVAPNFGQPGGGEQYYIPNPTALFN
jgi:hypothetical protein